VARDGSRRYRLLETVRAYAAGPETEAVRPRHAAAMVAAAEEQAERLLGPDQAAAVGEIDALLADLRQVVSHAGTETAGRIAGALYRYGYRRQHYEVLAWGRDARQPAALAAAATHAWGRGDLAAAERLARAAVAAAPDLYVAHEALGDVALVACDPAAATAHYREVARIGRMVGRPTVESSGLVGEALVLAYSGSIRAACRLAETALEIADASGNPSARAEARYVLGEALADTDPPRALALLDEAAALAGSVQDRLFEAAAESAAVAIRSRHGDPVAALTSFRAVLALWRRAGNDMLQAAALRNLVVLLARVGADETAALVDAALPASRLYAAERERLDRARAAVAERLGPDRLAAIRRRGARMPAAAVVDAALEAIDAALRSPAG
jgi:tetratricopeptide (TPR) repeat protein